MKAALLILTLVSTTAIGQVGTLVGRVTDRKTGDPLPGVNVLLQGTVRGMSTDANGECKFAAVPSGTYTVIFSLVGYQRTVRPGVVILSGDTTVVNASLLATALQTEAVIVTASRRETALQESPVSVSTLDAKDIERRNAVTIDDALRFIPGVNMTDWQVNIRGSSGYSRGAGSRVLMLLDGIPFLTGDSGELNYESIPAGQVDRIEVVKGASSALYGSGALGGVINVITKPIPDKPETGVRLYGGLYSTPSYPEWEWGGGTRFLNGIALSHATRVGDAGLQLFLSEAGNDGYRQDDYLLRYNGLVKVEYPISIFQTITLTGSVMDQHRGNFLYWKDLTHALTPPDNQLGGKVHSTRYFVTGIYNHTVSSALFYSVRSMWYHNWFMDTSGPDSHESRSDVLRGEVTATWGGLEGQIVTVGVEGNSDRVNADIFGVRSGGGGAGYLQDEIALHESLKLTLGFRFDIQKVDSIGTNNQFNPKAALVYHPFEGTTFRASYGRGFRSPSVAEAFTQASAGGIEVVPNPSLRPERSSSFEIGCSQSLGDVVYVDAAGFQSNYDDLIESGFNAQGKAQFSNVTEARVRGVELSTSFGFFERSLFFNLSYTYLYPRDLTANDILKYRPRHLFYVSSIARVGTFTFSADFRAISRVERIDEELVNLGIIKDGDQRVPIYVADLRIGADVVLGSIPLTATLSFNNMFQYNYVELIGNMAPPRSYVLTLDFRP
jgi:outer membrane receptor for ferrienterochelin and colicins